MNQCINCNKKTKNPKFCSRSCAAVYNNKRFPKRKKRRKYFCKICDLEVSYRQQYCKTCSPNYKDWTTITIRECQNKRTYQLSSRIRDLARREYCKSKRPQNCIFCDYNKYFEVHHIKAIEEFDLDTPISEVNNINNLVALCPNHHWEVHHNLISKEQLYEQID